MVDYETGEEIHKISPEWLGVPESKEALRKKKKNLTMIRICQGTLESIERAPHDRSWNDLSKKIIKEYWIITRSKKINIHPAVHAEPHI